MIAHKSPRKWTNRLNFPERAFFPKLLLKGLDIKMGKKMDDKSIYSRIYEKVEKSDIVDFKFIGRKVAKVFLV